MKSNKNKQMNALIIRLSSLGDVAMAIPVVYFVVHHNPGISFTILTKSRYAYLFAPIEGLTILSSDVDKSKNIFEDITLLTRDLEMSKYDMIFDLHGVLRSHLLTAMGWLRNKKIYRINKYRKEKKALIKGGVSNKNKIPSVLEAYVATFRCADLILEVSDLPSNFYGSLNSTLMAKIDLEKVKIGIAPFAYYKEKTYPKDRMISVIQKLNAVNIVPFIFGGKADVEAAQSMQGECEWHNFIDKEPLETEMQVIEHMQVMLCMDSANMHLSALVNTPVLAIWGPTHPDLGFGSWRMNEEDNIQVQAEELTCRPCSIFGNVPCRREDLACMNRLSPKLISEKILARIETN